ncbi:MAG: glutaminyl-peptide cyclotransferase [Candidatus Eremiobacteraeota bacterium]|nr:glutaminyl-peptide cyclotransferase [Candidatus Eremiobacteraeota bacterium]
MMRWFFALWLAGCAAPATPPAAAPPTLPPASPVAVETPVAAALWNYEVVERYPHDPKAYTQGLWMDPKGQMWETTGLRKESTLRQVDLTTGKFKVVARLSDKEFGEGLAFAAGRFFWITWDTQVCHTFDAHLKPAGDFKYEGEGWGLTTDPAGDLWMSNGSDKLVLRDPKTFAVKREISVSRDGQPLGYLNELEWVEGRIYANVYRAPFVAVIRPENGQVEAVIDFTGLLSESDAQGADVLNGIAYEAASKKLWVTGKLWPKLFQVRVRQGP